MLKKREIKRNALLLLVTGGLSGAVLGQEVIFRSVDAQGVVSFSDVASAGAEPLTVVSAPTRKDAFAHQQAIIDQQLAVAKVLEDSRLARERARTERIQALAAMQPRTLYYREPERTRYVGTSWSRRSHSGRPGYPNRPGHPIRPGQPIKPGYPGIRPPQPGHPVAPPGNGSSRLNPPSRPVKFPWSGGS